MWVNEDGIYYNNENPVVRDECWNNREYYGYDAEEDNKIVTLTVDYSPLDDKQLEQFREGVKLINWFNYAPDVYWDSKAKELIISGRITETEQDAFVDLCDEYDLASYEG